MFSNFLEIASPMTHTSKDRLNISNFVFSLSLFDFWWQLIFIRSAARMFLFSFGLPLQIKFANSHPHVIEDALFLYYLFKCWLKIEYIKHWEPKNSHNNEQWTSYNFAWGVTWFCLHCLHNLTAAPHQVGAPGCVWFPTVRGRHWAGRGCGRLQHSPADLLVATLGCRAQAETLGPITLMVGGTEAS